MKANKIRFLSLFPLAFFTTLVSFAQQQGQIMVGRNLQVSKDGNFTHEEFTLAANPKNPDNLLGGASVLMLNNVYFKEDKVYATKDGGKTWNDINFPEPDQVGSGDPQVGFGLQGTAYFITLCPGKGMLFYRSEDGGTSWRKPVSLSDNLYGLSREFDYEKLTVDHSFGKFAGHIYISSLAIRENKLPNGQSSLQPILCLHRSADDGKSFVGPMTVVAAKENMGMNVSNPLISSNGTLFFTYEEWRNDEKLADYFKGYDVFIRSSKDGGVNFYQPLNVVRAEMKNHPKFAIDNKSEKYKDRIYCIYDDKNNNQIMITYSKDEGLTWSETKAVDLNIPKGAIQHLPDVTVNSEGIVGIRWFDNRNTKRENGYDEFFTASLDGGETFLPPIRVSSASSIEPSRPTSASSQLGIPRWKHANNNSILMLFQSATKAHSHHYYQFTADVKGNFHCFWADSRDGKARQIYTSTIKVIAPCEDATKASIELKEPFEKEEKPLNLKPQKKALRQIANDVFLDMDESIYDTVTHILSLPLKVKNMSDKPIFGPITVKIIGIDTSDEKSAIPSVINAFNKKSNVGAEFVFNLGEKSILLPGNESESMTWRFKVDTPTSVRRYTKEQMQMFKLDKDVEIVKHPEKIAGFILGVTGYIGE